MKRKQDRLDDEFNSTGLSFPNNRKIFSTVSNNLNAGNASLALTPPTTPQGCENGQSLPNRIKQMHNNNQLLTSVLNNPQPSSLNVLNTSDQLLNAGLNNSYSNELLINQNQQLQPLNQDQQLTDYQSNNQSNQSNAFTNGHPFSSPTELVNNCETSLLSLNSNGEPNQLDNQHNNSEQIEFTHATTNSSSNNFCFNGLQSNSNPSTTTSQQFTINNSSFNIYNNGHLGNFNPHHSHHSTPNPTSATYNNYLEQNGSSSINSITAWSNRYFSSLHQHNALESTNKTSNPSPTSSLLNVSNISKMNSAGVLANEANQDVFNGNEQLELNQHHQLDNQFMNETHSNFTAPTNQLLFPNGQTDFCATYTPQSANYLYSNWNYS